MYKKNENIFLNLYTIKLRKQLFIKKYIYYKEILVSIGVKK